jgi:outer membrane protein assembly factor BamE (lipoprotein component of BamABCDE complex)
MLIYGKKEADYMKITDHLKDTALILCLVVIACLAGILIIASMSGARQDHYRQITTGMEQDDVTAILGNPAQIVENSEYLELTKKHQYIKDSRTSLLMPVEKRCLIYTEFPDTCTFVFIDNNEKVEKMLIGNSDKMPYWYERNHPSQSGKDEKPSDPVNRTK